MWAGVDSTHKHPYQSIPGAPVSAPPPKSWSNRGRSAQPLTSGMTCSRAEMEAASPQTRKIECEHLLERFCSCESSRSGNQNNAVYNLSYMVIP